MHGTGHFICKFRGLMIDVEFRVVGGQREGLLLALGQVVIANGFTLLRQRMVAGSEGASLTMHVRGPENRLLQLEENLGSHPLVRSFEASPIDGATVSPEPRETMAPMAAPAAAPSKAPVIIQDPAQMPRVQALLPLLAREYPNIFVHLRALEYELAAEQYDATLEYIGRRVGAWVYKRDFALGGQLPPGEAIRRIALPAMRQVLDAELQGQQLHVTNSPFCGRGRKGACCHFLGGMLAGLLDTAQGTNTFRVVEAQCRNAGAAACAFEFHH